ncbi:methanethiol oxidase [Galendromus occidentalis]|uniref:Methanethiol oxidase n=1 Tax=Galendromus occidentalis TaxID=34638 RepID=A0AAJ7L3P6_9ACAR|nr:methanethiol oxidase [Galendromus occidentalis]
MSCSGSQKGCCGGGPGYPSPREAQKGPREKLLYVPCIVPTKKRPDYLAVIDIDPSSQDYLKVIHRTPVPHLGDELHHMNWNACSSCYHDPDARRDKLVLPCLLSDRIYTFHVGENPREPSLFAVVEPEEIHALNASSCHTPHCLPGGNVMISTMGDKERNNQGSFILLNGKTFKPITEPGRGAETAGLYGSKRTDFGYDYWYQPRHDVMVSSEWGSPRVFENGFDPAHLGEGKYGHQIHFWKWSTGQYLQSIDLGREGFMPLETRFLHDPDKTEGFVGCAISSAIFRFNLGEDGLWEAQKVISIPNTRVKNWMLPEMPAVITDILLSLDDRFLYLSCWLTGEVRQYNIEDTANPKLVGLCYVGGSIRDEVTKDDGSQLELPRFRGRRIRGGPQMLQLSLDGKRLYLTTSLFSAWDKQFYPDMFENGSMLVRLNVDSEKGGLTVDEDFLVDFGDEPEGPVLAHEIRYPGGDCSSDIWS